MNLHYLLDTNALSEPFRRSPNRSLLAKLHQHRGEYATASISWHELRYGLYRMPRSARRDALERYLEQIGRSIPILPYEEQAAEWHAKERARLYRTQPPFQDSQIAAVAAVNHLRLITANLDDFANFEDLYVENWME